MTDHSECVQSAESLPSTGKAPRMPNWASEPFEDLIDQVERIGHLLHVSMSGISVLRGMPRIAEVLADIHGNANEETTQESIMRTRRSAELAQREVDEGFPLLHIYAALSLWSTLEATIRLFVARWLQNEKGALEVNAVQKLKVRISDYEALQGEDRFFYILDRLEQDTSAPLRSGVTRFESLLEPFGLSGQVDDETKRDLFELNEVRNAIMHRGGKADRRLIEACPWLELSPSNLVKIDHGAMDRYAGAVGQYALQLIVRIGEHYGVDMQRFKSNPAADDRL